MNKKTAIVILGALATLLPLTVVAQVRNESLANGIIAARQKNNAKLHEYTWNCRTEILDNGKLQDLRLELVSYGPDGELQHSLLNDQKGRLPGGFFRHAIAENQRKQLEKQVHELRKLVDKYTLPSAGAVVNFLSEASVQPITTAEGTTVLQVHGNNVVVPGDSFNMTMDGHTMLPTQMQVTTSHDSEEITVEASFHLLPTGLNHLQYVTVDVPSKNLSILIHNFDYAAND